MQVRFLFGRQGVARRGPVKQDGKPRLRPNKDGVLACWDRVRPVAAQSAESPIVRELGGLRLAESPIPFLLNRVRVHLPKFIGLIIFLGPPWPTSPMAPRWPKRSARRSRATRNES